MRPAGFSHLDANGKARMVDVSAKPPTRRVAAAACEVRMRPETLRRLREGGLEKGDAFTVAKIAAVQAAKRTSEFIPLCHPLALEAIEVRFEELGSGRGVRIFSEVATTSKTGVEMEALHAALTAALALYDMAKAADPAMRVTNARLLKKTGGKSDYAYEDRGADRVRPLLARRERR